MCSATEFDELPVRHNEDLINAKLTQNLPLSIDIIGDVPIWDPHVKAFLLRAYMSRIDLPISDYVGDQTSVLGQGIRIIQVSIDVTAELGYIPACQMLMTLLQCIESARWPEDHPLSILPGVPVEKLPRGIPASLMAHVAQSVGSVVGMVKKFNLPTHFTGATSQLPRISVSVPGISPNGMSVSLVRRNPHTNSEYRIYTPRFPKPQTEGYFLIVCNARPDGTDGELLGLKRVLWPLASKIKNDKGPACTGSAQSSGSFSVRSLIKFPGAALAEPSSATTGGIAFVNVKAISGSYIGMEWTLSNVEVDVVAAVGSQTIESSSVPVKD